jgi:2-polyprenyl-3-methyl-5-hydroxy-6-metoxy-1,4-benzoquinol methylase
VTPGPREDALVPRLARWAGRALIYRAPRERDRCPACESSSLAALAPFRLPAAINGRRTGLVSGCEACGLVFVNPPPSDAELSTMYSHTGEWAQGRVRDVRQGRVHEETTGEARPQKGPGSGTWPRLFDPIRSELDVTRPPAGARVLDFGCGRGKFLDVLAPCGWETFGIEPALDAAFARHQRLDAVPAEAAFDLIIAHHVLEHVSNPLLLLRQLAAAAKPRAFLLVAGPRLDTLPLHGDYQYVISRVHITAYTATCMMGLLARAGWEAVEPPRDEVLVAGGRRTAARLRILARRVSQVPAPPSRPLDAARAALRAYRRQTGKGTSLERLGLVRASARLTELRR